MKWVVLLLVATLLFGCVSSSGTTSGLEIKQAGADVVKVTESFTAIKIYPICEDGVVCYVYRSGYAGGMSCFDSKSPAFEKYCSGKK